jgi:hypothetical protein
MEGWRQRRLGSMGTIWKKNKEEEEEEEEERKKCKKRVDSRRPATSWKELTLA